MNRRVSQDGFFRIWMCSACFNSFLLPWHLIIYFVFVSVKSHRNSFHCHFSGQIFRIICPSWKVEKSAVPSSCRKRFSPVFSGSNDCFRPSDKDHRNCLLWILNTIKQYAFLDFLSLVKHHNIFENHQRVDRKCWSGSEGHKNKLLVSLHSIIN